MKQRSILNQSAATLLFVLICAVTMIIFPWTDSKAEVVTIEGASYNVNSTIAANLKTLVGKKVYITLNSGNTFSGFVKQIGEHLIHLEKLDGKDFFDALIRIDSISAIDTRFRDYQR